MPKKTKASPKLCRQRVRGRPDRAYVVLDRRKFYLGHYGTKQAKANRTDLTHDEQCDRCRPLIQQHLIRIREVWLRRLERELVDRIPGFPHRG